MIPDRRSPTYWLAFIASFQILAGCGPKADQEAEVDCPACQQSNYVCVLDIQNQVADQEDIVCSHPDQVDTACDEACTQWSASHTKACLGWSNGGAYLCHGGGTGADGADGNDESNDFDSGVDTTAGASSWNPGSYVSWSPKLSAYVVDSDLVDMLKYDASILANDPTSLEEQEAGGFAFTNVTRGSLASELGFQENDIPLTINGHQVRTLEDVLATLSAIYDDTALTVRIQRGSSIVTQAYSIQ